MSTQSTPVNASFDPCTQALDDLRTASEQQVILLDFDETLFLRNSTEEYLRTVKPQALAALILLALNRLKPWTWWVKTNSHALRDWCRVVVMTLLFPWTLLLWRRRARSLSGEFTNEGVLEAIRENPNTPQVIVASNGFRFIIAPLLKAMKMPATQLIACRFWQGHRDRQQGKTSLVTADLGEAAVAQALLLTDSQDDALLLDRVATPLLVVWPAAQCVSALRSAYIPLFYMQRVKKKGTQNFLKKTLMNEFLPLVLTLSWGSPHPLLHSIGLALLFFSFWCIYEIGYMENDLVAEHHESNPTLSDNYLKYKGKINYSEPWLWATVSAIPALLLWQWIAPDVGPGPLNLMVQGPAQIALSLVIWLVTLLLLRLTYWVYNYIDEQTRVWIYPVLQIFKYASFLLLTPGNLVVVLYFSSQVIARWIPYLIYRNSQLETFPNFPIQWARFVSFLFLLLPLLCTEKIEAVVTWQTLILLGISLYRAKGESLKLFQNTTFLSNAFRNVASALRFGQRSLFKNPYSR